MNKYKLKNKLNKLYILNNEIINTSKLYIN